MAKTKQILAYAIPFGETCEIFGNEKIYTCSCGDWYYIYMGHFYSEDTTGTEDIFDLNQERMRQGKTRYKGYQFGIFTVNSQNPDNCTCKHETQPKHKTIRITDTELDNIKTNSSDEIKFDTQRAYDVLDFFMKEI